MNTEIRSSSASVFGYVFAVSVSQSACTVLGSNGWGAVTRLTRRLPLPPSGDGVRRRTTGHTADRGAVSALNAKATGHAMPTLQMPFSDSATPPPPPPSSGPQLQNSATA